MGNLGCEWKGAEASSVASGERLPCPSYCAFDLKKKYIYIYKHFIKSMENVKAKNGITGSAVWPKREKKKNHTRYTEFGDPLLPLQGCFN